MLWYKAWLETRSRFLVSLCSLVALPSYIVFHEDELIDASADWYYRALHNGHKTLAMMWVLSVTLLMMGGLLRERAVGTSSFTLALPVSRARLMRVRILSCLLQAMALVIIPWSIMFLVAINTGKVNSIFQAFFHVVLLTGGGLVFFALALLVSSLVEGEYTAPAVSFGILFTLAVALGDKPLSAYSPLTFIQGSEYIDRKTALLVGPVPWLHVMSYVALAALLVAVSIRVIQRRAF